MVKKQKGVRRIACGVDRLVIKQEVLQSEVCLPDWAIVLKGISVAVSGKTNFIIRLYLEMTNTPVYRIVP